MEAGDSQQGGGGGRGTEVCGCLESGGGRGALLPRQEPARPGLSAVGCARGARSGLPSPLAFTRPRPRRWPSAKALVPPKTVVCMRLRPFPLPCTGQVGDTVVVTHGAGLVLSPGPTAQAFGAWQVAEFLVPLV